jgi:hypothetical protein
MFSRPGYRQKGPLWVGSRANGARAKRQLRARTGLAFWPLCTAATFASDRGASHTEEYRTAMCGGLKVEKYRAKFVRKWARSPNASASRLRRAVEHPTDGAVTSLTLRQFGRSLPPNH